MKGFPKALLLRNPENFIAKKALIFSPLLTIVSLVWLDKWYVYLAGLIIGILASLFKIYFMGDVYTRLLISSNEQRPSVRFSTLKLIAMQLFSFFVLVVSSIMGFQGLIGAFLGILIVPGVIFVNSITEYIGLSKNKFRCR